jgi:hypothetical protein
MSIELGYSWFTAKTMVVECRLKIIIIIIDKVL